MLMEMSKYLVKLPGADIIANKKTFLLVKALEIASAEQFKQLQEQFGLKEFDPEIKVRRVIDLYDELNIRAVTENIVFNYINTAMGLLEKTSVVRERKEELTLLAGSLIGRER